jgi:hypothetical protein
MNDKRIPPLHLEQAALGERDDARVDPAELEALREDNAAILEAHPPARVAASIRARADAEKPARAWWRIPAMAAPLAAAAAVLILVALPSEDDGVREKGARPHLVVETEAGRLADGDRAPAGTTLQLSYVASGAAYGAVLSVDGAGQVTQHLPRDGARAVALAGERTRLPSAFTLDDAPGFERFYLVTSDAAFALDEVRAALADGRAPGGVKVMSLQLVK